MTSPRPAVCYVVSHYTSSGHTAHLPRFFQELSRYADVYVALWNHDDIPDFPGVRAVYPLKDQATNRLLRMMKMVILAWRLRRRGCQVFFVRIQYHVAIVLSLFGRVTGIKVFLWQSGLRWPLEPPTGWSPGQVAQRLSWYLKEKVVFPLATRLVTRFVTSPASMIDYYRREYGVPAHKFLPLNNDVDTTALSAICQQRDRAASREELGLPGEAEIMLYVGAVSPRKLGQGGTPMLEVARQVLSHRPSTHLVLVGSILLPDLQEQLEQAPWGDRVHFTGGLPLEQVIAYYLAADLCVFPCAEAGFPRVLLEAMALGVPFVSFDIGGFRDLVEGDQVPFVVPQGDVRQFVQQVERLLEQPAQRQRLREVGLERVKAFSTELVARDFFERIVLPFSGDGKR